MRVRERGKYISVCRSNYPDQYDDRGNLVFRDQPFDRKTNKLEYRRKLRRVGRRICLWMAGH